MQCSKFQIKSRLLHSQNMRSQVKINQGSIPNVVIDPKESNLNLGSRLTILEVKQMFILLLMGLQTASVTVSATGNHLLKRTVFCIFVVYCVLFLAKQSASTVDFFKN